MASSSRNATTRSIAHGSGTPSSGTISSGTASSGTGSGRASKAAPTAEPRRASPRHRRHSLRRLSRVLAFLLASVLGPAALPGASRLVYAQVVAPPPMALPSGGQVVVGQGVLSQQANRLVVQQGSARLGIDWQSFSIGSDATVEFRQPDANSIALNRVLGNDASQIYGRLQANGQVFLTNPNGVLFAPGARVDVGGLVATTLDLSQQDFEAGLYRFRASAAQQGKVENQGELRATHGGYLVLLGQEVANRGSITVDAGKVLLASGSAATVSISGGGLISAVVQAHDRQAGRVENSGLVQADGGTVTLSAHSAQAIAQSLVNSSGIVRAQGMVERNGEIWITGDQVQLSGTATAAAPAGGNGGQVHVLGDMQRGRVDVSGRIDASAAQGRGGFVDTSAATVKVADSTRVSTLGQAAGLAGTWLIDPPDYVIAPSGGDITGATLSTNLGGGDIIIQSNSGAGGTAGNIVVNDTVTWSANRLTLQAQNDINVNQPLVGSGTARLTFEFGLQAVAASNTSRVNLNAPVSLPSGNNFSTRQGSNGTAINFSVVTTLAELQALDGNATVLAGNYALGASFDATGNAFNPIGNETVASFTGAAGQAFTGRFDGLGNRITGLTINLPSANYVGLFAITSNAVVRNLELVGGSVIGSYAGGGVVGAAHGSSLLSNLRSGASVTIVDDSNSGVWAGGVVSWVQGTGSGGIERSSASGAISATSPTSTAYVGGVVGEVEGGFARDLSATGTVTAVRPAGGAGSTFYVGGAVGSTDIGLVRATASGNVSGGQRVGGLVGFSSAGAITDSSATGSVTTSANSGQVYVGGLAGWVQNGSVSNVSADGAVSSTAPSGGTHYAGGLAGAMSGTGSVNNAVARGNVSVAATTGDLGGLVGNYGITGSMANVEAQGAVSGGDTGGGLIGYWSANGTIGSFTLNSASVSSATWAGGFIGYMQTGGALSGINLSKNVTATGTSGSAGGLFGRSFGSISNSSSSGNVQGNFRVGGLVGQADGSAGSSIATSSASGTVTHTDASGDAGGLVGYSSLPTISGSSASGNVSGGSQTGGLVGQTAGTSITGVAGVATATGTVTNTASGVTTYSGGLVGYFGTGTLTDVRADGNVSSTGATGTHDVGGLVGQALGTGSVTRAEARGSVSSASASGSVGGLFGQYSLTGNIGTVEARGAVTGGFYTGGLIGYSNTAGTLSGVTLNTETVSGGTWVGGVLGYGVGTGAITAVTVAKNVTATGTSGSAGGLAGRTAGNVSNSSASGNVSGNYRVGGLIGEATGGAAVSITGSSASGTVTHTDASGDAGGLAGYSSVGTISGSSASGNVSGGNATGGLVGQTAGTSITGVAGVATATGTVTNTASGVTTYSGGLVGYFGTGTLTDVRADGNVSSTGATGTHDVGGLVGQAVGTGSVTRAEARGSVSSASASGSVGGLFGQYSLTGNIGTVEARGAVTGGFYTGGLIGYQTNNGSISGVTLSDLPVSGSRYVGGVLGLGGGIGTITGVVVAKNVTATGSSGVAGGLAGYTSGSVVDSSASGTVSGSFRAGGLIGEAQAGATNMSVTGSSASGTVTVTTTSGDAGGLIGYSAIASISGSTASGNVSGGSQTGGLVGQTAGTSITGVAGVATATGTVTNAASGGTTTYTGGLVGYFATGTLSNVSATGNVSSTGTTGTHNVGGLVGVAAFSAGSASNVLATGTVSAVTGTGYVGGLFGQYSLSGNLSTAEARGQVDGGAFTGGLIGYASNNGSFSAITLTNASVTGRDWVGGVFGQSVGPGGVSGVTVAKAVTATGSNGNAGGMAGYFGGPVSNSSASGAVQGNANVGGLIGEAQGSAGATITGSSASGNVTSTDGSGNVGGLIGLASGGAISGSRATGTVSGGSATGGLVGRSESVSISGVANVATATGGVSGGTDVGGLVGYFAGTGNIDTVTAEGNVSGSTNVGGVVGRTDQNSAVGNLTRALAKGNVSASTNSGSVGGLAGYWGLGGSITDNESRGTVSGGFYTGGLVGFSDALGTIERNTVTITSLSGTSWAGGLIGYHRGTASIIGLSSAVNVTATGNAGGVAGYTAGSISGSSATGTVAGGGSSTSVGGLVGEVAGNATVSNSSASGGVTHGGTGGYAGGLIGNTSGGTVSGSNASGNVSGGNYTGGLIGYFARANANISGNTAGGNVTGQGDSGGLVGWASGTGTARASNNLATGTVTSNAASGWSAGGLFGYFGMAGGMAANEARGNVSGAGNTGGLVGHYESAAAIVDGIYMGALVTGGTSGTWTGGLFGLVSSAASITGLNAAANVVGSGSAGGLAGRTNGNVTNATASGTVRGRGQVGGLVGQASGASATLTDSSATGAVTNTTAGGTAGGLVGYLNGAGILRGTATGAVVGADTSGGLVGFQDGNGSILSGRAEGSITGGVTSGGLVGVTNGTGRIEGAVALGNVTTAQNNVGSVGGLVGELRMAGGISLSEANGTVSGGFNTGGLVGYSLTAGSIVTSQAKGATVSGGTNVGGLVGHAAGTGAITGITVAANVTAVSNAGGLVGQMSGTVSSSTATGTVTGAGNVGGLVGYLNNGNVTGSAATGTVTNSTTSGTAGGLVGYSDGPNITGSNASGAVTGGTYAGGLIGRISRNDANVSGNTASGNVTGSWDVGGLIGFANGSGTASVQNNTATGTASSTVTNNASVGGLVGYFAMTGGLSGNEARGNVSGGFYTGGLVGYYAVTTPISGNTYVGTAVSGGSSGGFSNSSTGGFIGYSDASAISNVSVAANVTSGGDNAGGLVGRSAGSISNASASGNVVGVNDTGGLVGESSGSVTLTDVTANGTVSTGTSTVGSAGGLVGHGNGGLSIVRGRANGSVSADQHAGGLVGFLTSARDIRDSRADGNVSGIGDVGGLFGYAEGSGGVVGGIANGRVTNPGTAGQVGGIAGEFYMAGGMSNAVANGLVSGGDYTGGLAGSYSAAGSITGSRYTQPGISGGSRTGGLIGNASGTLTLDLTGQTIETNVTGTGSAGGVIGQASGTLLITGGTASGTVTSSGNYAGGFIGYADAGGTLDTLRATGNITSNSYAGGLGGWVNGPNVRNSSATGNVTVVSSTAVAGGLFGLYGWFFNQTGSISGSTASGTVTTDASTSYSGGLIGQMYTGSISTSSSAGTVIALDAANGTNHFTGGLVGLFSSNGSIATSSASGSVSGRYFTGGLVGYFTAGNTSDISASSATGAVSGGTYTGGLVGYFEGRRIVGSSASGAVSGIEYVGGLAGYAGGSAPLENVSATGNVTGSSTADYVGGLVGQKAANGIVNGFASGTVTASSSNAFVGGLVGYASLSGPNSAINDSLATGAVSGGSTTGGLVGGYFSSVASSGIVNSSARGNVSGNASTGGLVGDFGSYGSGASLGNGVRNSSASGNVSGTQRVGGLVGNYDSSRGISQSFATGNVTSRGAGSSDLFLGGLVGSYRFYNNDAGNTGLVRSYATGSVGLVANPNTNSSTDVYAGGLIGQLNLWSGSAAVAVTDAYASGAVTVNLGAGRVNIGGLLGDQNASIVRTYATGAVAGSGAATYTRGGLVARKIGNVATLVTDSHWDTQRTGQASSAGGGTGRTTAEMRQLASFTNWSIGAAGGGATTWRIYEGFTDPLLTNFLTPATIALADATKQYDGTTSFGNATLIGNNGAIQFPERIFVSGIDKDVGVYAVSAANVFSTQNGYDLSVSGSAALTVTPRPLTLAGVIADKVYDGTRNATVIGTAQPTGLVPGEDLLVDIGNVSAVFSDKNVGTNKTVTVSGYTLADGVNGKASNYSLGANTNTNASITPAPLTAGGFTAVNRAYDGTTLVQVSAAGGGVSGVIGNDDVQVDVTGVGTGTVANKNVGTNKPVTVLGVALTGVDAQNYRVVGIDGVTVNITPKAVVVNSLVGQDRTYNANTSVQVSTASGVIQGLVAGDLVELIGNNLSGQMADKNVGTAKPVTVTGAIALRGPDAANYSASAGSATVNISPALVYSDVNAVAGTNRVYDGTTDAAVRVDLYGVLGNDSVSLTFDPARFADKNVAYDNNGNVISKTITVTGLAITGSDAANYTLNTSVYGNTTQGTISPKPLGVTGVVATNRTYDGTRDVSVNVANANVDLTAKIAGDELFVSLPGGGTVTGTIPDKNSGTARPVSVPGFGLAGADARNYTLTGASGVTVDIARRDVTASYTGRDRVYDGRTWAVVLASTADFIAGDDIRFYSNVYADLITNCPFCYTNTGVFTGTGAKNVGTDKPIRVVYDELLGNDRNNYRFVNAQNNNGTFGTATATVTPKPITDLRFTGSNRTYDGTDTALVTLNLSSSGFASGDSITSTQTATFADKNVGTGKAISVSGVVIAGTDAFNYSVTDSTGTAAGNITPKGVAVSGITGVNRPYDGTNVVAVNAGVLGSSGFIAGDDVRVEQPPGGLSSGTVADKNVGANKPVTVTGLTLAGLDAANYRIDPAASGILVSITPRAIGTSWVGVNRVYNGGVSASVVGSSNDIVSGDAVGFSQLAVFTGADARNVGDNKPIAITDITLTGADRSNYTLASTSASAVASITPKPITVSYQGVNRLYNGVADVSASVTGSSIDLVAGDIVTFGQSARFRTDGSAGVGKIVDVSGITLGGAQARNYSLASTTAVATATINPRPIGVTGISAVDRMYDATLQVAVNVGNVAVDTSAVIAGDDVGVLVPGGGISTGLMATKDVGQNKPVQVTGLAITGAQGANYTLAGVTGITVNIAPRPLTATYGAASKVYDGSAVAAVSATSADILAGDLGAIGINAAGSFADGKNVGVGKTVIVSGGFLTGVERNNYTLQNPAGTTTASITPRLLTPAFAGISKVYDGTAVAGVSSTTPGIVAGDQLGFTQTAVFSAGKNVGSGKAIAVSDIALTGADAANYGLVSTLASASASITPKPITIAGLGAVQATPRTYDGSTAVQLTLPPGVTLVPDSGDIVAGDVVTINLPGGVTTGTMLDKHAGTNKPVRVDGLSLSGTDAANYVVAGTAGITVNIAQRDLTAVWAGITRTYDGTAAALLGGSSADLLAGDTLTISGSGVFTGAGAKNAGTDKPLNVLTGILSGADARNYRLTNPSGNAVGTVLPRQVSASFAGGSRVYDGTTDAPVTGSSAGFVSGDDIGFTQTAVFTGAGARNAGTGKPIAVSGIALSGTDAANYTLLNTSATASGSITRRPVRVLGLNGVSAVDRVYDGTTLVQVQIAGNGTLALESADLIAGDTVNLVAPAGNSTTGSMLDKHAGNAKAVNVDGLALAGSDAGNYLLSATSGVTVNIGLRGINASFNGVDRVYDGSVAASVVGTSAGVIAGDTVQIRGSGVFTGSGARNAGENKPIDVLSASLAGSDARNYLLLDTTGTATGRITPRPLTGSWLGGTRVYDGTVDAPVSAGLANLVAGDSVSLAQTAVFTGAGARNVGNDKAVAISGITLLGTDAGNYVLANAPGSITASITPRPLRLLGVDGISATDRVYDGTTAVAVFVSGNGAITPDPRDLVAGDVVSVVAPAQGSTTGTMSDKNAGTNKPVAITGLQLSGTDALNYSVTQTSGVTVNITPRPLTASWSGVARVYDGSTAVQLVGSSADVIAGDSVGISGSGVFSDGKGVGSNKPVSVSTGALSGADALNYVLANPQGTASGTVTPRAVTVAFSGGTRVYDGTTTAPVTGIANGFVAGDQIGFTATAAFTGANARGAGTAKPVQVSGITLTGDDAVNYFLTGTSALTSASVTQRPLRIDGLNGVTAQNRAYDGTRLVQVTLNVNGPITPNSDDLIAGDVITVGLPGGNSTTGLAADRNVGIGKAVTVNGLTLGGADAANYVIAAATGVTVDISPREVTAVYAVASKIYDGSTAASIGASSADLITGDAVSLVATGRFADRNAGAAKPVQVSDGALQGADAANYRLLNTTATASGEITPRQLQASFSGGSRVYDGTTAAPVSSTLAGVVAGDAVSLAQTAVFLGADAKNVGSGKPVAVSGLALSGADAGNYTVVGVGGLVTAAITPRPVDISGLQGISAVNRVYDGTLGVALLYDGTIGNASGNFLPGDDVTISVPGNIASGQMLDRHAGNAKPVVISGLLLGGADARNYVVGGTAGVTVDIAPKTITAGTSWLGISREYDGSVDAAAIGSSPEILGVDSVTLRGSGRFADRNAGLGKSFTITGATLEGADRGNYALGGNVGGTAVASITPKAVTAAATGVDRVYDGSTAAQVNTTLGGLVAGDAVALTGNARFTAGGGGKNVGTDKEIEFTGLALAGADALNYRLLDFTLLTRASVTPRPVDVTGVTGIRALDRVYDGTRLVQLQVDGNVTVAGADFLPGDDVGVGFVGGATGTGTMADKHAGSGKAVVVGGLELSGADRGNYRIAGTAGVTVDIAPREVQLGGLLAVGRVYDGTTAVAIDTSGGSIGGLLAGDELVLPVQGVTGRLADKNAGLGRAVTVSGLVLAGADARNYVAGGGGDLRVDIAQRLLTVTMSAPDKVYDGTLLARGVSLSHDGLAGDVLVLAGLGTPLFDNANAGSGRTVTLDRLVLDGIDGPNYRLAAGTVTAGASITPAPLQIAGAALSKVYGNVFGFTGTEFVASGLVAGETIGSVTLASDGAAALAAVRGTPYEVVASNARGGSFLPGNYAIGYNAGTLRVDPRPLTIAANSIVAYAGELGTLPAFGWSSNVGGLVGGDRLGSVTVTAPPNLASLPAGTVASLVPGNATFASGSAANYALRYTPGLLLVLPTPPRVGDGSGGDGGGTLAIAISPEELAAGINALQRASELLNRDDRPAGGDPAAAGLRRSGEASAEDLAPVLNNDGSRITLPLLQRLPLITIDPELLKRRVVAVPAPR